MKVSSLWAKLLFSGLVVALAGLLGVGPVWAQDEAGTGEETIDEATGDDSDSADELLATALELARSIQAGDATQSPVRVESRQASALAVAGEVSGVLALPPVDLRYVSVVDSKGNSRAEFSDPQYLGDDLQKIPEIFREYLSLRSQRPEFIIVDGVIYDASDLVNFIYFHFPDFGEQFSLYTPWVSRVLSDVVDVQSDEVTRFLNVFFEHADPLTAFAGVVGEAQYIENLLGHSVSASSVGQSNIRGHETTEMRVRISAADLLWINIRDIHDAFITSLYLGFDLVRPSDALISEIFAADNLVEFTIWIDESGRVHRLVIDYSKIFSSYMEFALSGIVDLEPGDLEHTTVSEFIYLDEDPAIVAPAADEVRAIESISSYETDLLAAASEGTGGSEGSADQGPGEGSGEELADTGANTPLLAILGVSAVLAGAMVFALSRRLRPYRSLGTSCE